MEATKYQPAAVEEPPVYNQTTVEISEEPPKYDSLFAQLKAVKTNANTPIEFVTKSVSILGGSTYLTIGLVISCLIPVASLVIGFIKKDDCPIEKWIPMWLIVFGAAATFSALFKALLNFIALIKRKKNPEYELKGPGNCLNCLINLFIFAWFIAGNVWVYRNYSAVTYDSALPDQYCDKLCYLFSFWLITATWGFLALLCFCCCGLVCCIGGCGILCTICS